MPPDPPAHTQAIYVRGRKLTYDEVRRFIPQSERGHSVMKTNVVALTAKQRCRNSNLFKGVAYDYDRFFVAFARQLIPPHAASTRAARAGMLIRGSGRST